MVFCNILQALATIAYLSHNPYFNRWFSAIMKAERLIEILQSHNPYFNRWFSAILKELMDAEKENRHNPYFNRWFSAIGLTKAERTELKESQSLF